MKQTAVAKVAQLLGVTNQTIYARMHYYKLGTAGKSARQILKELQQAGFAVPKATAAARSSAVAVKPTARKSGNAPVRAPASRDIDTGHDKAAALSLSQRMRKALVILTPLYEQARKRADTDSDTIGDLRFREAYKILVTGQDTSEFQTEGTDE